MVLPFKTFWRIIIFPVVAGSILSLDGSFLDFSQDFIILNLGRRQSSAETVQLIKKVSCRTGAARSCIKIGTQPGIPRKNVKFQETFA